ncbi:MAG: PEP-utilizing enzyme [Myxococcota bacterium]
MTATASTASAPSKPSSASVAARADLRWAIDEPGQWEIDEAHFPTPLTPYCAEILAREFPRGFREGSARIGLLLSHFDHQIVNGFDYIAPRIVGAPKGMKGLPPRPIFKLLSWLHPEMRRRLKTAARAFEVKPWREDVALWETEIRPQSTATHLELQRVEPDALDDAGLGRYLVRLRENAGQQYFLHHRFTVSAFLPVGDFMVHAQEWTGLPTGDLLQACRQKKGVATVAGEQFERVVAALRADPTMVARLGTGSAANDAAATVEALAADAGPVGAATRAWLEMTAHRLVTGYDITDLVALEMPELLVRTLRIAIDRERVGDGREAQRALAAKVRDAVPDRFRGRYDELLAEAISISNLREERALVCDFWAYGLVRRALKVAGRRLAARGRIADPGHLFDASHAEMLALVSGVGPAPSADELARRYAYRTSVDSAIAPKALGLPRSPPPPLAWLPPAVRRQSRAVEMVVAALFDEGDPRSEPKVVSGLNASAGSYEGTARVVLRAEDFPRIQAGDVLVARMTTEAYNGIIPLLGAIVTDRGGLLTHAATVAREFGIPAVVGTHDATQRLPNGARVRVDGGRGEARVIG